MSKIYYLLAFFGYLLDRHYFINTRLRHSPHLFTFSVNNFVKKSLSIKIFVQNHYKQYFPTTNKINIRY
ncbi:hypothetical protein B6K85_07740 [Vibrio sp. V1B]|nr:hypothetical protein B6K85_07740 [Vibrio sp. V1B]